jgi:NAD(P)-dependent dehydrogenase (short-subunit alcohol dehydrogenase family)
MTIQDMFSLAGKVALITGGSGDIGMAIARVYAEAGAAIALNGRSPERLRRSAEALRAAGAEVLELQGDVAEVDVARATVAQAHAWRGRIDVLVNCAGSNRRKAVLDVEPEDFETIVAVHLRGAYFTSQATARHMIAAGSGKIIHIGSATIHTGLADVSVYGAAKSGLAALTRSMAVEWAEHGIQVNCLAPGFIMTELTREGLWANERRSRWLHERIPQRRPGLPEEMAGVALLLAAPASSYLTGQVIHVDGGFAAGSKW